MEEVFKHFILPPQQNIPKHHIFKRMGKCMGKPAKKKNGKSLPMESVSETWNVKRTLLKHGATVLQTSLLEVLEEVKVISTEQRNAINTSRHSNIEQMEEILNIVDQDPGSQDKLLQALTETGQKFLVDYISNPIQQKDPANEELRMFLGRYYAFIAARSQPWFRSEIVDMLHSGECIRTPLYSDGSDTPLDSYQDLFRIGIPPVRILVQGETGIGKSTLLSQMASDWGQIITNSEWQAALLEELRNKGQEYEEVPQVPEGLAKYDLVLHLQLKCELNTQANEMIGAFALICNLIDSQMGFLRSNDRQNLKNFIASNPDKVLLLIDDIEYCPENCIDPLKKIIYGDELKEIFFIGTSKKADVFEDDSIHCLWKYEIKGQLKKQAVEYAKLFAQNSLGTDQAATAVSDMLRDIRLSGVDIVVEEPDSWSQPPPELAPGILRFGGLLHARCKMWENRQTFPVTWTQSCSSLILQMLKRHQRGCHGLITDDSLMEEYGQELFDLGHIAFDIILTGKYQITFKKSWLIKKYELTERAWQLGIIVKTGHAGDENLATFSDSYLVEYLASYYIIHESKNSSVESKEEELKACCPHLDGVFKYRAIFRIICGLSHVSGNRLLQWCVSTFADTLFPNQIEPFAHFLLECLAEYENKQLARFPLPPEISCSINEEALFLHEILFGMKLRTGPEYGKVSKISLYIHPSLKLTEKMVTDLIHPMTSGPLKELFIVCGDSMTRDAYQQLYNEVKFMKNLTTISLRLHRRHKDDHFFRSLLNKLSALEKLSVIDIRIEHPDIPAPLGQGGGGSPYASFCV